jgi:hypothetical protein
MSKYKDFQQSLFDDQDPAPTNISLSQNEGLAGRIRPLLPKIGKRPRVVLEHILKHGFITTDDLSSIYNYRHTHRAVRDVRELGIPIETFRVKSQTDGRMIGAYRLPEKGVIDFSFEGRRYIPKDIKKELYESQGESCALCHIKADANFLQADHRIPYEVLSELENEEDKYMLLCGSCQCRKGQACKTCPNALKKSASVCASCFWVTPANYTHVQTKTLRTVIVNWKNSEMTEFQMLSDAAKEHNMTVGDYLKHIAKGNDETRTSN